MVRLCGAEVGVNFITCPVHKDFVLGLFTSILGRCVVGVAIIMCLM